MGLWSQYSQFYSRNSQRHQCFTLADYWYSRILFGLHPFAPPQRPTVDHPTGGHSILYGRLGCLPYGVFKLVLISSHRLMSLQLMHTDTIIVWRVWVLFPNRRKLLIGPIVLLVAYIGKVYSECSKDITDTIHISNFNCLLCVRVRLFCTGGESVEQRRYCTLGHSSIFFVDRHKCFYDRAGCLQVLVCGYEWLPYIYLWFGISRTHRKTVKHVQKQSRVLNVLFLMVESGVLYALLQVIPPPAAHSWQ